MSPDSNTPADPPIEPHDPWKTFWTHDRDLGPWGWTLMSDKEQKQCDKAQARIAARLEGKPPKGKKGKR